MSDLPKKSLGWPVVLILSFVPVVLWLFAPSALPRFGGSTIILGSLGQVTGLIGAAMFGLNLILSARLTFLEKHFRGLNRVYLKHSQLGQISLLLLLVHPFLLLQKYAGNSLARSAEFLLPSTNNWPQTWGILGLWLMVFLIILTLYLRPEYNIWKLTHKFLGFAFFLGALHIFLIPSDTYSFLPLRVYMLGLAGVGLLAFLYRSVFGKWLVHYYTYKVTAVTPLNQLVTEIRMEPVGTTMPYTAGQFIFISFKDKNIGSETHPFSMTSDPNGSTLSIGVKNLGDYTSTLNELAVGSIAKIEGPFGVFSYENSPNNNQVWIAGGIGITPFVSMARSLKPENGLKIDFYYCFQKPEDAAYLDVIQQLPLQNMLNITPFCGTTEGRIDVTYIENKSGPLVNKDIYLCAPPVMIEALRSQLLSKGVPLSQIHSEEFNF